MSTSALKILNLQLRKIVVLILLICPVEYPQAIFNNSKIILSGDYNYRRAGDLIRFNSYGYTYSSTPFMTIHDLTGTSDWFSPKMKFSINGRSTGSFPLNLSAVDLLPIDLIQTGSIELNYSPSLTASESYPYGGINFISRPISDSALFSIRFFTGSETGDPLIYSFTRSNLQEGNENKIVPSVSAAYEDKSNLLAYRLSAGYFGYFAGGSQNDRVIAGLSDYYLNKQNKQVFIGGEFEFPINDGEKITFSSSLISYYGWEAAPFVSTYSHIESYVHSITAAYSDSSNNFKFSVGNDGNMNTIHNLPLMPGSKFSVDQYSAACSNAFQLDEKLQLVLSSELNLVSGKNLSGNESKSITFLSENINKFSGAAAVGIIYDYSSAFNPFFTLRYDNHFTGRNVFSFHTGLNYSLKSAGNISIKAASIVNFPNWNELYGRIELLRYTKSLIDVDTFAVRGSGNLREERSNSLEFLYCNSDPQSFSIQLGTRFYRINNPITVKSGRVVRTNFPSDVVRDANFTNDKDFSTASQSIDLQSVLTSNLKIQFGYRHMLNEKRSYIPKHSGFFSFEYIFPFKSKLSITYNYTSKTVWNEFKVQSSEDYFSGTGLDGVISEMAVLNVFFEHKLKPFYLLKELVFRLNVNNLFDRNIFYLPNGHNLGREIFINISCVL